MGQVLLAPLDFVHRQQYLHARQTLSRLLELGVVPVVNENDATSDDEIRFGDNDRLAALVAHLVAADLLVLLTDTAGLLTADPRTTAEASLIEEVVEVDHELEVVAGGAGSAVGSGGMASKLAAAKIAAWSGRRDRHRRRRSRRRAARRRSAGTPGVGTVFRPRPRRLPARKLWIAFAVAAAGTLVVDEGARAGAASSARPRCSPPAWCRCRGASTPTTPWRSPGPTAWSSPRAWSAIPPQLVASWAGRRTSELPDGVAPEVVHRDDLVVLG